MSADTVNSNPNGVASEVPGSVDAGVVPKASANGLEFLQSIDGETDFQYLLFDDNLVTVSDTGKELGEFTVTVEPTKYKSQELFLIHANSHGAIDGVPCGTSITCYVTKQLETIEQQHHEYVKLENCPLDRKTFIVRQEEGYVVNRVITQGRYCSFLIIASEFILFHYWDVQRTAKTIALDTMQGFISEGSNLLLHRLLIEKNFPDDMQLLSFDSDANLSVAVYKHLEERSQNVEGLDMRVFGIERTIISTTDLPTTWQSYFSGDCHLTNRVQVGSPVTMKLAQIPTAIERDEEPPKPTFEKQPLNWEEDMQLYSRFLDRKEELKGDHAVYMRHHPELKALLADFLQFLLLRKPDDVLSFAAEYFAAFSNTMPSSSPYMASSTSTPFPASRTNTGIEKLRTPTR